MKKKINQDVIQSLNEYDPANYIYTLGIKQLISPQGALTLDYLVKDFTITEEAKQFAEKHFGNFDSEVMEAFQDFFYEVCRSEALELIKRAEEGDEVDSYILEYAEDERFDAAFEDVAEDTYHDALASLMACIYDEVTLSIDK